MQSCSSDPLQSHLDGDVAPYGQEPLVVTPFAPSSFLLLVVRPGAPSSFLATSSNALVMLLDFASRFPDLPEWQVNRNSRKCACQFSSRVNSTLIDLVASMVLSTLPLLFVFGLLLQMPVWNSMLTPIRTPSK